MEWQPIETASKGTLESILVYSTEGVEIAWWSGLHQQWLTPEGKDVWDTPTHWMPLPNPPQKYHLSISGK